MSCYYFYLWDVDFGPAFIKVCSYFPYPAKIWLNGHEWAKRQVTQAGIGFTELSSRASPHPDEACNDRLPVSAQAHAGTCGQGGRPPPLATPMHGDRDAKCICAGQVRCLALWSEHSPRYAVRNDSKTHT